MKNKVLHSKIRLRLAMINHRVTIMAMANSSSSILRAMTSSNIRNTGISTIRITPSTSSIPSTLARLLQLSNRSTNTNSLMETLTLKFRLSKLKSQAQQRLTKPRRVESPQQQEGIRQTPAKRLNSLPWLKPTQVLQELPQATIMLSITNSKLTTSSITPRWLLRILRLLPTTSNTMGSKQLLRVCLSSSSPTLESASISSLLLFKESLSRTSECSP